MGLPGLLLCDTSNVSAPVHGSFRSQNEYASGICGQRVFGGNSARKLNIIGVEWENELHGVHRVSRMTADGALRDREGGKLGRDRVDSELVTRGAGHARGWRRHCCCSKLNTALQPGEVIDEACFRWEP